MKAKEIQVIGITERIPMHLAKNAWESRAQAEKLRIAAHQNTGFSSLSSHENFPELTPRQITTGDMFPQRKFLTPPKSTVSTGTQTDLTVTDPEQELILKPNNPIPPEMSNILTQVLYDFVDIQFTNLDSEAKKSRAIKSVKQHFGQEISKKATQGIKQKSSTPESLKIPEESKPETKSTNATETASPLPGSSSGSASSSSAPIPSAESTNTAASLSSNKIQYMETDLEFSSSCSSNSTSEESNMEKPPQRLEQRDNHTFFNQDFSSFPFQEFSKVEIKEVLDYLQRGTNEEENMFNLPFHLFDKSEINNFIEYVHRMTKDNVNESPSSIFHLGNWMNN